VTIALGLAGSQQYAQRIHHVNVENHAWNTTGKRVYRNDSNCQVRGAGLRRLENGGIAVADLSLR